MTDPNLTHLALIVDRSGSMQPIAADMNGAILHLLHEQAKEPGNLLVDVVRFDTTVETVEKDRPVAYWASRSQVHYVAPRGGTALHDAIGITVGQLGDKFSALEEDERPGKVIVVVVTDGEENSSREYTGAQIKTLITQQETEWGWTFLYLAANVDAFATGAGMGFARGQTISYAPNAGSTHAVYASAGASITRARQGGSANFTDEEREAADA